LETTRVGIGEKPSVAVSHVTFLNQCRVLMDSSVAP
jgi:hypothetical protein